MEPVLSGPPLHPALLDHLAHLFKDERGAQREDRPQPATADATLAFLAALPFKNVVDIVAPTTRSACCAARAIVDALGANPLTGRAVIERILSFIGIEDGEVDEAPPDPDEPDRRRRGPRRPCAPCSATTSGEHQELLLDDHEEEIDTAPGGSLYALIQNMSVFQKIKLGRMGNKEARSLLVRDRNKVVSMAAVTSPKITDNELIAIAKSRNVCDEVIRVVARNKDVTRNYQVKQALATNPKTPQATAMKFVNYLQERDLRGIMKSKDVPSAISTHARRILMRKGKL